MFTKQYNFNNEFDLDNNEDLKKDILYSSEFIIDFKILKNIIFEIFDKNKSHPLYIFFKENPLTDDINEEKEILLNNLLDELYATNKNDYFKIFNKLSAYALSSKKINTNISSKYFN